jgi:Tfp pilus assembly protein PilN
MKRINLMAPNAGRSSGGMKLLGKEFNPRLVGGVAVVILIAVGLNINQRISINTYESNIRKIKKNINIIQAGQIQDEKEYASIKSQRLDIHKRVERLLAKTTALEQLSESGRSFVDVMGVFGNIVPEELWIDRLSLNEDRITIDGSSFDNTNVSEFMVSIEEARNFKNTSFTYTQKEELPGQNIVAFEITTYMVPEKISR